MDINCVNRRKYVYQSNEFLKDDCHNANIPQVMLRLEKITMFTVQSRPANKDCVANRDNWNVE